MFARFFRTSKLVRVPEQDEDGESLLPSSSGSLLLRNVKEDRKTRDMQIALRTIVFSTAIYVTIGVWIGLSVGTQNMMFNADEFCINHASRYSPLVKEVKPSWHTVQFNGSFLHENIYRQAAGPEVDAAWEALGTDYRSVLIPPEEAEKTGLRHDQVRVTPRYGGGFPANVEGLHHLHCLNLVRKALKWNYEYYKEQKKGAFTNGDYIVRYHVTHCLDILRQQLMCVTDIGVLGQVWWQPEGQLNPEPFVDFNTKHRCRDFEAIRRWAEDHQLPPEEKVDLSAFYQMPAPGDTVYPEIP